MVPPRAKRSRAEFLVREARPGDGPGVIAFFNEATRRGLNRFTVMDREADPSGHVDLDSRYARPQPYCIEMVAVETTGGSVVGSCAFVARPTGRTSLCGKMSWGLHPDYLGRGIATGLVETTLREAAKRGYLKAEASIAASNAPSLALAARCGFKVEGRQKWGMRLDNGRLVDVIVVGKVLGPRPPERRKAIRRR